MANRTSSDMLLFRAIVALLISLGFVAWVVMIAAGNAYHAGLIPAAPGFCL